VEKGSQRHGAGQQARQRLQLLGRQPPRADAPVQAEGLQIEQHDRFRLGITERLAARKPAAR